MSEKCQRCGHDGSEHEGNGGECQHVTYSEERTVHDNPEDGITIQQDWRQCECPYLLDPA